MSIPVKYVFVQYRSLVLPVIFTAPFSHAEFSSAAMPIRSAGYARRVNSMGVQPYDRSTSLDVGPDDADGLRLSSVLTGYAGTLNFALLWRDGECFPAITTLPIMAFARLPVVRSFAGAHPEAFGVASVVEAGLGVRLHPHVLPLETGDDVEPMPDVAQTLNFWLRDVLEVQP